MDIRNPIEVTQYLADLLGRNRISDGENLVDGGNGGEWATGTLTHWMKCKSGSCYFKSVFCGSVSLHRSSRPIFVLQPSWEEQLRRIVFDC
ncbi:hypothetical protein EVAR_48676_1 [Eumeta japonica]|uniref:Uncharacterized protein n=1 Tax=Eumeta variegata TaxID=151549 RepID=A0A4C1XBM0_EUMVA|nr:hypothetical protein EVAR_48676_1 [Eumeta japonica]